MYQILTPSLPLSRQHLQKLKRASNVSLEEGNGSGGSAAGTPTGAKRTRAPKGGVAAKKKGKGKKGDPVDVDDSGVGTPEDDSEAEDVTPPAKRQRKAPAKKR